MGATVNTLFISGESKIPSSIISEEIKNKFEFNEDFYRIKDIMIYMKKELILFQMQVKMIIFLLS